jgi:hypothetical protein
MRQQPAGDFHVAAYQRVETDKAIIVVLSDDDGGAATLTLSKHNANYLRQEIDNALGNKRFWLHGAIIAWVLGTLLFVADIWVQSLGTFSAHGYVFGENMVGFLVISQTVPATAVILAGWAMMLHYIKNRH